MPTAVVRSRADYIDVTLAALVRVGDDPSGGALAMPWRQAGLVVAGAVAVGLIRTLIPAALVGRVRATVLAGLRE